MMSNSINRFGSAAFANAAHIHKAGMYQHGPNAVFLGFFGGAPLYYHGAGGLLLVAGARSGKLRDVLSMNVCAGTLSNENLLVLDPKGELAAISHNLTPDRKHAYYWNPLGMHGLPSHRFNPFEALTKPSRTLVPDAQLITKTLIEASGGSNAKYFEGRAEDFLLAIILTLVNIYGRLTFPDLYRAINLIPTGNAEWLDLAFEMTETRYELTARIEEEIAQGRENPQGGYPGIMGEIFRAVTALADPTLLESLSPNANGEFDFSFSSLTQTSPKLQAYLMPPAESIGLWSRVLKLMFTAARIAKSRAPSAPRITFIVDEAAQLGKFKAMSDLYTIGAGIGIRPWAVYQGTKQMDVTVENGQSIMTGSAGCRSYFAIRDIESATAISNMLGSQTLEYEDAMQAERARHAKAQMLEAVVAGHDPMSSGLNYAHHRRTATIKLKQQRMLRTPDEVMNMADKQFIFADGLPHPIHADRKAYYDIRFMKGRYYPNPYHPDPRGLRVKGLIGHKYLRVIRERVPREFARYPQYKDGTWMRLSD